MALIHHRNNKVRVRKNVFFLDGWGGKIYFESLTKKQRNLSDNYNGFVGKYRLKKQRTKDRITFDKETNRFVLTAFIWNCKPVLFKSVVRYTILIHN